MVFTRQKISLKGITTTIFGGYFFRQSYFRVTTCRCKSIFFFAISDIELNPDLKKACKKDIPKFCHDVTGNDQVIPCLKTKIGVSTCSWNIAPFAVHYQIIYYH